MGRPFFSWRMADTTIECPSCALPIDPDVEECPYCGYELPRSRTSVAVVAVVLVIVVVLWMVL